MVVFAFGLKDIHHLFDHHHETCTAKSDKHYHDTSEWTDCVFCAITLLSLSVDFQKQDYKAWFEPEIESTVRVGYIPELGFIQFIPRGPPIVE